MTFSFTLFLRNMSNIYTSRDCMMAPQVPVTQFYRLLTCGHSVTFTSFTLLHKRNYEEHNLKSAIS